jgi:hypothetical protein
MPLALSEPMVSPSEIQLLKKEIEAQGEFISQERLERLAETDKLKIELESIKETLQEILPDFLQAFERNYGRILQTFNPEQNQHKKKVG